MTAAGLRGIIPSVETLVAVAILTAAYLVRIAAAGDPSIRAPWYLTVVTDAILPIAAAAWLFTSAFFVLLKATSDDL